MNLRTEKLREFVGRTTDWIRICHVCAKAWEPVDYLCEACWKSRFYLDSQLPTERFWRDGIMVRTLFSWKDSRRFALGLSDVDSRDLAALLRAFKGGHLLTATDRLAARFWSRWVAFEEIPRYLKMNTILVPAPSVDGEWDHAMAWATALGRISGLRVAPILARDYVSQDVQSMLNAVRNRKPVVSHQRERNKHERRLVKLKLTDSVAENYNETRFIFIDDVVTTGATLATAYEALGRPLHFECWAIACRG